MSEFINYLFYTSYFLMTILLAFFIPGNLFTKRINLSKTQRITLSIVIGMVFWGIQGYLFGYLKIRWASYAYLLTALIMQLYYLKKNNVNFTDIKQIISTIKFDKIQLILIILGIIVFSTPFIYFGLPTDRGFNLCCGDFRDNLLHMAYINQVLKNFPPMEPGLFGQQVTNYHYWMHIVEGELIRVFKLPLIDTVMRFFPIMLSLIYCLLIVSLGQTLKFTKSLTSWLLFFFIFCGDFIYVVNFLLGNKILFGHYLYTSTSLFINYPYGFSIIILLGGLNLLALWLKTKSITLLILTGIVLGSVVGFKVNVGFFAMSGLGFLFLYGLIKRKVEYILIFTIALITSLAIFIPPNSSAGGLIFTGFWRAQDFIVQPEFRLSHLELARIIYHNHNNWPKELIFNLLFTFFFFFIALGPKIGIFFLSKKSLIPIPKQIHIYLIPNIILSIITGFFFIQRAGGANSMFFITTSLLMLNIYVALFAEYYSNKLKYPLKILFIVFIILLTIPTSLNFIKRNFTLMYLNKEPVILNEEMEALKFLQKTPKNSIILVPNNWLDGESSYITLLGDRPSYLSGQQAELRVHDIYYEDRQKNVDIILKNKSEKKVSKVLRDTNINYIYLSNNDQLKCKCGKTVKQVFHNSTIKILKVN